jgi:hypothetical protein
LIEILINYSLSCKYFALRWSFLCQMGSESSGEARAAGDARAVGEAGAAEEERHGGDDGGVDSGSARGMVNRLLNRSPHPAYFHGNTRMIYYSREIMKEEENDEYCE